MNTPLKELIATAILFCHGHAEKGESDNDRQLSPLGLEQAKRVGARVQAERRLDLVLSSPVKRVVQTTKIVTGKEPVCLPILGISEDPTDALNIMFNELQYSPLITGHLSRAGYFEHRLGESFKSWSRLALNEVLSYVEEVSDVLARPINLAIGGHAVMLPALTWAMCQRLREEGASEKALQTPEISATRVSLGEAESFYIDLRNLEIRGVINFSVIAPT